LREGGIAGLGLFEADQKFAESVEPGMGPFHHPAAGFGVRVAILDEPLFGARFNARVVAMLARDLADRIAYVASVQAKILLVFPTRDFRTFDDDPGQRRIQ
jgi:hypothetical protein